MSMRMQSYSGATGILLQLREVLQARSTADHLVETFQTAALLGAIVTYNDGLRMGGNSSGSTSPSATFAKGGIPATPTGSKRPIVLRWGPTPDSSASRFGIRTVARAAARG
ncbi:hypothetical protein K438DRAFT_1981682 [Mycena galopus ATCC 62051]|nr:hypothetical protein K438DRAFT_1981682 [Mycena galopus ATCC 62051]